MAENQPDLRQTWPTKKKKGRKEKKRAAAYLSRAELGQSQKQRELEKKREQPHRSREEERIVAEEEEEEGKLGFSGGMKGLLFETEGKKTIVVFFQFFPQRIIKIHKALA